MINSIFLVGQWVGQFVYGQEYGDEIFGEKVQFRLFVEKFEAGEFTGKSVDVDGFGANLNEAIIKGFIQDDLISFTKEYQPYFIIDETGNTCNDPSNQKPRLSYKGVYNKNQQSFCGEWEFWTNEILDGERGSFVDIFTGTWDMKKDN